MKKHIITLLSVVAVASLPANPYKGEVKVNFGQPVIENGQLRLEASLQLDALTLKRNQIVIFTPKLVAADGKRELSFEQTIVSGKHRTKILKRAQYYGRTTGPDTSADNFHNVRRRKEVEVIRLEYNIRLEEWMRGAQFEVHEETYGCYNCEKSRIYADGTKVKVYPDGIVPPPYDPDFALIYITPEIEPVKVRSETHSARLHFMLNKWDIRRDFSSNKEVLDELDERINDVRNNPLLSIRRITVDGYASPEGPRDNNEHLSVERAGALAHYLRSAHNFGNTDTDISSRGLGEDWVGLREIVAGSYLAEKEQVLRILDGVPDSEQRKARIRTLNGGGTYRTLLKEYYPPLRRNEYTIEYQVRGLTPQEAEKLIWERPELLSLNEMFMVAQIYDPQSEKFKKIFGIAAEQFPESGIAMFNVVTSRLEKGDHSDALDRLTGIDTPEAWNNLGVAYWHAGNYGAARELFDKASRSGNAEASKNMNELKKWAGETAE